jgi:hypothetical protein
MESLVLAAFRCVPEPVLVDLLPTHLGQRTFAFASQKQDFEEVARNFVVKLIGNGPQRRDRIRRQQSH